MRATDRRHPRFRQAEVFDLAFLDQVLHRSRHVLDGDVRIDAVLIEEIDPIGPESRQGRLGHLPDMHGPAVQAVLFAVFELESELGRNHDLIAHRAQRFAHELFVGEGAIRFRRIEERDAAYDSRTEK
jgi:hypothetical protein